MEIILSAAISLDGYLDDCSPTRLKLSSPEDWEAVQQLRASCDAILVGAGTIRTDNPSLVIRNQDVRRKRMEQEMDPDLVKITVTASGKLDRDADFFKVGEGKKIIFAPFSADGDELRRLATCAEIIMADKITPFFIRDTLQERGFRRLMVEGGSQIHTMFITAGVVDRLRLAVAPFFVGDKNAPRFVNDGFSPWNKDNRLHLEGIEMLGDTAVMHYNTRNGR